MDSDTIATLQAVADAIAPGLAKITLDVRSEAVYEADDRPGYQGRNRLATWVPCDACAGKGETVDAEGFPLACKTCLGHKGADVDPQHPHPHVVIDIGHHVVTSFGAFDGKGRVDRRPERSLDVMNAIVRAQVGNAAIEVLASNREIADSKRVRVLADAAIAGGHDRARVEAHVARRMPSLATTSAVVVTISVAKCGRCGARTSCENESAVRAAHAGGVCAICGGPVTFSKVRRLADGTEQEG